MIANWFNSKIITIKGFLNKTYKLYGDNNH